jgi:transcriptional antiterminator RfaH
MNGWFLVQTKPRQEDRALENLEMQGVKAFCPKVFVEKISRGKRKVEKEVLFPNYLFVRMDQDNTSALSVNYTRGVSRIISFGNKPATVSDRLISQLQDRVNLNEDTMITDLPEKGEQLTILDGSFRGLNAIFSQIDGDSRAIVLITILSQKVKTILPLRSLARNKKAQLRSQKLGGISKSSL